MNPERAPRGVKADFEPTDDAKDNEFPKVRERNPEHGCHRACGSVPHCQQQWLWGEEPSSQRGLSIRMHGPLCLDSSEKISLQVLLGHFKAVKVG